MPIINFIRHTLIVIWKKLAVGDKYINKQVQLFVRQTMFSVKCIEKKKILGHNSKDISLLKFCWGSHLCEMAV